jgi:radical SAM superfamily enzyme YgiQ (UPF0313 family)
MERSAEKVIQELEELLDKYNPKMLVCVDNSINGNNLLEFCTYFENYKKPLGGMARADLSKEEIEALRRAGCNFIYFGLESGSDRVLNEINKGISSEQMSNFIKELYGNNIIPAPSLFVGAPCENRNDFEKTIKFIVDHKNYLDIINLYPFMVTPSSDFSVMGQQPDNNTLFRLSKIIKICTDIGIKVCVGEQTGEYILYKDLSLSNVGY